MKTAPSKLILGCLYRAMQPHGVGLTDGQLLGRYVARKDEEAFAALVRRYGPMVYGVCRRVLCHAQDAEDAFQATFVVLARKAARVKDREAVGGWLHGVAYRCALAARESALRRMAKEQQVEEMPHPLLMPEEDRREELSLLDRELVRLPEKLRLPVVLCELEGRSRREAALQLGIPEGTLSSRLANARKTLVRRMAGRGAAFTAASLAALLASQAKAACVPALLLGSTVRAAGGGAVSARVAALVGGVLKAMLLTKIKIAGPMLFVACLLCAAALAPGLSPAQDQTPSAKTPAQSDQEDRKLLDTILKLERKLAEAGDKQDVETLARYTADNFLGAAQEGRYTKADMLDGLTKFRFTTFAMDEIKLVVLNKDAVVLSYKARFRRSNPSGGEAVLSTRYVSSTWARQNGNWMYAFSSQVPIPDEAGRDVRIPIPDEADQDARLTRFPVAVETARTAAARMNSINNLKQMALAMHAYMGANGQFPADAIYDKDGKPLLSWRVAILPYIDQSDLYNQFHLDEPWDGDHNKKLLERMPKLYGFGDETAAKNYQTHYQGFVGKGAFFDGKKGVKFSDIPDGTANTIMLVEAKKAVPWTKPDDIPFDGAKLVPQVGGLFEDVFDAALADGSARSFPRTIKEKTLRALVTRDGGETVDFNKLEAVTKPDPAPASGGIMGPLPSPEYVPAPNRGLPPGPIIVRPAAGPEAEVPRPFLPATPNTAPDSGAPSSGANGGTPNPGGTPFDGSYRRGR